MAMAGSQSTNASKSSYLYYVVEFPDEKVNDEVPMTVISHSWVNYDEETGIPTCIWPKRATDAQRILMTQKHKTPSSFIPGIHINIKYKALTYEKAVSKMKELERLQSVSQSEASDVEQTRKRSIKPKHYEDFTSSAESEDDLPTLKLKTKRTKCSTSKTDIEVLCNSKANNATQLVHKSFVPQTVVEEITTSNKERFKRNMTTDITVQGTSFQLNETDLSYRTTSPLSTPTSSRSSPYNRCACESNEVLLKKLLVTVQSLNNEMKVIKHCLSKSEDIPEESDLIKTFPLTTQEQLESFNDTVTENCSELVSFCQLIGGKDVIDTTRRLLTKIVGQNLAETYNWCGKNNKPAFSRLKNIVNFIVGVVRKNKFSKSATQQEVETVIKSWLRTATDRNGGRNRRRSAVKSAENQDH